MQPDYILEMRGITKLFPGVRALADVDFEVTRGHVHALVGENGAGKSTLIKIISGVYPHGSYEGQMFYDGKEMKFQSIRDVEKEGIVCIHQELNVVPELSVAENIFLNEKPTRFGFIDFDKMYVDSMGLLEQIGLNSEGNLAISPDEKVRNLGIGQKQMVEIAKALAKEVRLLILDEPTRGVDVGSIEFIHKRIIETRDAGIPIIVVSTELDEVSALADRIAVMYRGTVVGIVPGDTARDTLGLMMAGETEPEAAA